MIIKVFKTHMSLGEYCDILENIFICFLYEKYMISPSLVGTNKGIVQIVSSGVDTKENPKHESKEMYCCGQRKQNVF